MTRTQDLSLFCQVVGEQHSRHNSITTYKRIETSSIGDENVSAFFLLDIQELDYQQVSLVSGWAASLGPDRAGANSGLKFGGDSNRWPKVVVKCSFSEDKVGL